MEMERGSGMRDEDVVNATRRMRRSMDRDTEKGHTWRFFCSTLNHVMKKRPGVSSAVYLCQDRKSVV